MASCLLAHATRVLGSSAGFGIACTVRSLCQVRANVEYLLLACRRLDMFYPGEGEGWFTGPSKYPLKLAGFWVAQAAWNFTVLLPVTVAQAAQPTGSMGAWGWIGFALFMGFFAFEAAGVLQLVHATFVPMAC